MLYHLLQAGRLFGALSVAVSMSVGLFFHWKSLWWLCIGVGIAVAVTVLRWFEVYAFHLRLISVFDTDCRSSPIVETHIPLCTVLLFGVDPFSVLFVASHMVYPYIALYYGLLGGVMASVATYWVWVWVFGNQFALPVS